MKLFWTMLCTLIIGCSSAPERRPDYICDGVETSCPPEAFAHPGYAPVGAGLPEYRPVEEEPEVPRSPYKRILPQTPETMKEDGLWSAEEPKAAIGKGLKDLRILGVRIPYPLDDEGYPTAKKESEYCAEMMDIWLQSHLFTDGTNPLSKFSQQDKNCFAAQAHLKCIQELLKTKSYEVNKLGMTLKNLEAAKRLAIKTEKDLCDGVDKDKLLLKTDVYMKASLADLNGSLRGAKLP